MERARQHAEQLEGQVGPLQAAKVQAEADLQHEKAERALVRAQEPRAGCSIPCAHSRLSCKWSMC